MEIMVKVYQALAYIKVRFITERKFNFLLFDLCSINVKKPKSSGFSLNISKLMCENCFVRAAYRGLVYTEIRYCRNDTKNTAETQETQRRKYVEYQLERVVSPEDSQVCLHAFGSSGLLGLSGFFTFLEFLGH